ncbi:hypothetical protein QWY90_05985 [Flavobacterium paronense]|nr:hypothetical protein [Flavobacterium paronense]MDN3676857.1 hypothetical protein [Flavobacterium paronense]
MVAALLTFRDYQPIKPEYSISSFTDLINTTKGFNNTVAGNKQAYSLAVENRIQVFDKGQYSIDKVLSPVNGTVKVIYGRISKEARDVAGIISKIRGANNRKKVNVKSDQAIVSQSYQSYNSKAQFFADMIVNLTNFGTNYQPTQGEVKIAALNDLYTIAVGANNLVMNSFSNFVQTNATRIDSYYALSQMAVSIKDSVKAQYGFGSPEYQLIKGLKV